MVVESKIRMTIPCVEGLHRLRRPIAIGAKCFPLGRIPGLHEGMTFVASEGFDLLLRYVFIFLVNLPPNRNEDFSKTLPRGRHTSR